MYVILKLTVRARILNIVFVNTLDKRCTALFFAYSGLHSVHYPENVLPPLIVIYFVFTTQLNHLASLAKWLSVRLRIKWL